MVLQPRSLQRRRSRRSERVLKDLSRAHAETQDTPKGENEVADGGLVESLFRNSGNL